LNVLTQKAKENFTSPEKGDRNSIDVGMGLIHFDPSATRFCLSCPVHIIRVHKLHKKRHPFQVPDFDGGEVQAPFALPLSHM